MVGCMPNPHTRPKKRFHGSKEAIIRALLWFGGEFVEWCYPNLFLQSRSENDGKSICRNHFRTYSSTRDWYVIWGGLDLSTRFRTSTHKFKLARLKWLQKNVPNFIRHNRLAVGNSRFNLAGLWCVGLSRGECTF